MFDIERTMSNIERTMFDIEAPVFGIEATIFGIVRPELDIKAMMFGRIAGSKGSVRAYSGLSSFLRDRFCSVPRIFAIFSPKPGIFDSAIPPIP